MDTGLFRWSDREECPLLFLVVRLTIIFMLSRFVERIFGPSKRILWSYVLLTPAFTPFLFLVIISPGSCFPFHWHLFRCSDWGECPPLPGCNAATHHLFNLLYSQLPFNSSFFNQIFFNINFDPGFLHHPRIPRYDISFIQNCVFATVLVWIRDDLFLSTKCIGGVKSTQVCSLFPVWCTLHCIACQMRSP